ncbi:MAG TPA: hypothetical protein VHM24_06175 [Gemmatimonadaceae bacterium]|nr:hypothetical protein [Gemmatimonadaceae bacterium]
MTDDFQDEEFAPIAAAMKELPAFSPSPDFADKVMKRVRISGAAQVPVARETMAAARSYHYPPERRVPAPTAREDLRRSVPARLAVTALVTSLGVTMTAVALAVFFDVNLFLLVSRVFGASTMTFLASLATDASASAALTASNTVAAAGTATGVIAIGSFAAGVVATTAALRAAASASRKAA